MAVEARSRLASLLQRAFRGRFRRCHRPPLRQRRIFQRGLAPPRTRDGGSAGQLLHR